MLIHVCVILFTIPNKTSLTFAINATFLTIPRSVQVSVHTPLLSRSQLPDNMIDLNTEERWWENPPALARAPVD